MKFLKVAFSPGQIRALLRKDLLVRWRQPWMSAVQLVWPCVIFMLLYLIRLKFKAEPREDCQFPTRLLPTKHNVVPGLYSYICTIENKCSSTKVYEEYSKFDNAPMKPVVDIVQIFINDDRLFNSLIELPEKGDFIKAVTSLVTSGRLDDIRKHVEKVIALLPEIERTLSGGFDIKNVFSDRQTFVKAGNLLCGHPFPNTDSIPLVNDILYSEDFSEVNDDELNAMPTKYCKRLYLDITSTNQGKITWETVKPIIQGKIIYAPRNEETESIMKFSNDTFEEMNRLKMLSVAVQDVLTKLREDESFQKALDGLLKLASSPFVRKLLGDEVDVDQIQSVVQRVRTDPMVYDVVKTVKNLLECFSVDRFEAVDSEAELRKKAFDLNQRRLFYAAVFFNDTQNENVVYKFHMDTENSQPTIENKNRFWFPGPAGSMLLDMKYHRGFVQIKQALDLGIIKHKKQQLLSLGLITEAPPRTTQSSFSVKIVAHNDTDDDNDDDVEEDDDDDDWFTFDNSTDTTINSPSSAPRPALEVESTTVSVLELLNILTTTRLESNTQRTETETEAELETTTKSGEASPVVKEEESLRRQKRQSLLDLISGFGGQSSGSEKFQVDDLQFFTKQFPYPAYTHDNFKTGIYLAQAVQVAFFLGLVAQIASCVRHLIWMRESRNSMIMRSMGLKPCSEMTSWIIVTFVELVLIFAAISVILYSGGILTYTRWLFIMVFLFIFGACLIAFCYMCSTFFASATIGAVATALFFFISLCPYIIVLLFDAKLSSLQNFAINLSFSTAFAHGWSHIMRMELQEVGLTFEAVFVEGFRGEYGFSVFMIVLDTFIYIVIGYIHSRYKNDEFRFVEVQREDLDASVGATLTNVSKIYDDNKIAVSNISLTFPRNKVTCLLGRNGAGKSTVIKMLTGQVVQTTGRVILSQAMSSHEDFDKVGMCSQDNILIPNLTAREHLELYAKIKLKHGYESEVTRTLRSLNFGKYESYQASELSGGYQRRLCVALAFIGSPNVVILDEPCNGVDTKARKSIWELIERLRKGRAVIFATHFLDEAEHLSDVIVIMKHGKIIAKHNPETLKNHCTAFYELSLHCCDDQTIAEVTSSADQLLTNYSVLGTSGSGGVRLRISYEQQLYKSSEFLQRLHLLERQGRVRELSIESENLEVVFKNLDRACNGRVASNGHIAEPMKTVQLQKDFRMDEVREGPLRRWEAVRLLLWKRLVHFSRNYRMLMCVIVLPALFELCAMWFVAYRLEDDFDKTIPLSRALYPQSTQVLSMQLPSNFTSELYSGLKAECGTDTPCKEFPNSELAFFWILETLHDYRGKRYGGYTFNGSKSMVWYNNKGYHAMMAWLNDLNSHLLQSEVNDTAYTITAYNEPWKLGFAELSTTSILRQAGDSCLAFILLVAFSLVVAVAAVYLVNERMRGEKLQQKLCGVDAATYWGVAFLWDFMVIVLAILVCAAIILAFGMGVFTDRQQLWGIVVLALFFGFACIPAVHVFEKCFSDSSFAIVAIFCLNIIIPLFTMSIVVLLGVVGDSPVWDDWRYFLNRAFLIFPQHALGDGLLEICKNYMVALTFRRYGIDSYKNPLNSDLLQPHLTSLFVLGVVFAVTNILVESGLLYRCRRLVSERLACPCKRNKKHFEELKIVSIQNSLKRQDKVDTPEAVRADGLCKSYGRGQHAVYNVSFAVRSGECFGLLGKNGAGKSTIFKMLSGQLEPDVGHITYSNGEVSYCPQTNTLDSLLTVQECIEFYGRLRRISDIPQLVAGVLEYFQLELYRDVLVKNLSGGNRRKLTVATTCCGRSSVVLMDEPTSDMDPVTRAMIYRTIDDLLGDKRAIVLTSHSISEIDEICHRVAVLKDGQVLTCSSPDSLKSQYGGYCNVTVFCNPDKFAEMVKSVHERLPGAADLQIYSNSIKFSVKIDNFSGDGGGRESRIDGPEEFQKRNTNTESTPSGSLSLSQLFRELSTLQQQYAGAMRYAVSRCRLDDIFERILDRSDREALNNSCVLRSDAVQGTPSTGYIHNGYIETETIT